jgi:hypothetical protein
MTTRHAAFSLALLGLLACHRAADAQCEEQSLADLHLLSHEALDLAYCRNEAMDIASLALERETPIEVLSPHVMAEGRCYNRMVRRILDVYPVKHWTHGPCCGSVPCPPVPVEAPVQKKRARK